jgi:hypothetical protein
VVKAKLFSHLEGPSGRTWNTAVKGQLEIVNGLVFEKCMQKTKTKQKQVNRNFPGTVDKETLQRARRRPAALG